MKFMSYLLGATGAVALAMAASATARSAETKPGTYRGPAVALGKGKAYAWVSIGEDGAPKQLGVSLSEKVMNGIERLPDQSLTLALPAAAKRTGFDHVYLNWNRHGHPPEPIYGAPHFDVHFYWVSEAARRSVDPKDGHYLAKAQRHPPAEFVPKDYVPPPQPEPVPRMGVHWADVTSPEFNGRPFTYTFIYGGWDGQFTFVEPMIAKAFLESRTSVSAPVKQPARFAKPGYYPTSYRIDFDPGTREHRVVLERLTKAHSH